jgi:hypothetical protein
VLAESETTAGGGAGGSALLEDATSLWEAAHSLAHDYLELAALEAKLAGQSLVTMLVAGVMLGILIVSAWLGLVSAGVLVLIDRGVSADVALVAAVSVNLVRARRRRVSGARPWRTAHRAERFHPG